jgi:hypothetical protein
MISSNCDFKEFIQAIKDKDYTETIYLTDQEATWAERSAFRSKSDPKKRQEFMEYSSVLKDFIKYFRCAIKPKLPEGHEYQLFLSQP